MQDHLMNIGAIDMNQLRTEAPAYAGRAVEFEMPEHLLAAVMSMSVIDGRKPDGTAWTIEDEIVSAAEIYIDNRTSESDFEHQVEAARNYTSPEQTLDSGSANPDVGSTGKKVKFRMPEPVLQHMLGLTLVDSAQPERSVTSLADSLRTAVSDYLTEREEDPTVAASMDELMPLFDVSGQQGSGIRVGRLPDGRSFRRYY